MTLPRYPAYKDSGVEWLGEVPAHWKIGRIGHLSSSGMGQTILKDMLDEFPTEDSLPVYSASVGDSEFGFFRNPDVRLEPGDLIIGARGSIGNARKVVEPSTCTQTTIWIKPECKAINADFLYWVVVAGREGLFPYDKTAIPMLTVNQVRAGRLCLPAELEQEQISSFLDHETSKIDALIAEQQNLIALLKEKRQAVISHAVTKGLSPDVPMKDSGVEWLGEVPAHWSCGPLKYLARLITGMTPPTSDYDNYAQDGFPWVRPEDISEGGEPVVASRFLSEKGRSIARQVNPFSVLICCIGTIGKTGMVFQAVSTNQQITAAEISHQNPRYFYFVTLGARRELETMATGNVLKILNTERLGAVTYPIPPLGEQVAIATFLDDEISKIDTLIAEAERTTGLLRERRSALISAAVTGKIDVRCLAPQEAA